MSPQNISLSVIVFYLKRFFTLLFFSIAICSQSQISYEAAFPELTFEFPVELQSANDGTNRMFVVEQMGKVKVFPIRSGVTSSEVSTFLDISDIVGFSTGQEIGLLGLAFHPNFSSNGQFFVYFTEIDAEGKINMVLNRYLASDNPNLADLESGETIFRFKKNQDNSNHNGGKIAFGPDGYLYASIGDGGGGGDPAKNGQNLNTVFGSILRIDVDVNGDNPLEDNPELPNGQYEIPADNPLVNNTGLDELYAWGIRNTWKFSFDAFGRMWAADVGQNVYEEINLINNGGNYGWNRFEALSEPSYGVNTQLATTPDIEPIYYYDHSNGDLSITGGYFYQGNISNPLMANKYIFGDYVSGRVWALDYDPESNLTTSNLLFRTDGEFISSFGLDLQGNLYFSDYGLNAQIYQIKDLDGGGGPEPSAEVLKGDWSTLQEGVNGTVETIAIDTNGDYYVGGLFSLAGGITVNNLAKYSELNGWEAFGEGTNGKVNSIAIDSENNIYVGGNFTTIGGIAVNYVGKWNGVSWSGLGTGTNGEVLKVAINSEDEVFVGGTFISAGELTVNNVAQFNGSQWAALTDSGTGVAGTNNEVREIKFDENGLMYLGGNFDSAGNKSASRIAIWNGTNWSTLGGGTSGFVQAIEVTPEYIYAGGNFAIADNKEVNRIARWSRTALQWEALNTGLGGNVNTIVSYKEGIVVGGNFLSASGAQLNNIAYWEEGKGWFAVGNEESEGVDNAVRAILKKSDDLGVVVGGAFQKAGNAEMAHIANFDFSSNEILISCPEDIVESTFSDSCARSFELLGPTVTGISEGEYTVVASRDDELNLDAPFGTGETVVTWEVFVDEVLQGTCTQSITITDDTIPIAVCKNITVELDGSGTVGITPLDLDNGSTDNCAISSYGISKSEFTIGDLGVNEVEFIITDTSGNTNTCVALVTVNEVAQSSCSDLPTEWTGIDIGEVGATGNSCYDSDSGVFEVEASGADIWGRLDEFHFVYQELTGDGEIVAQVLSLDNTNDWAKAGVMMRNSTDPNSQWALMSLSPNPRNQGISYTLQNRPVQGGAPTINDNLGPVSINGYPHYLRLVREGNEFFGYASDTTDDWQLLGSYVVPMEETILVGLAVTSHNDGTIAKATFNEVSVKEVTPVLDNVPPEITLLGENPMELELGATFVDPGATASDNIDGDISSSIVVGGDSIDVNKEGTYTLTYNVVDLAGNNATEVTRTINIIDSGNVCGPLPAPWTSIDVGAVGATGTACYVPSSGVYEVQGSGADIWASPDEFQFVYQEFTGDGEIIAQILSFENTDNWAKAGVMMRNSLAPDSPWALMAISPNPWNRGVSYTLQNRKEGTVPTLADNLGPIQIGDYPHYLRLVRQGDTFFGYASSTNGDWQLLGSYEVPMEETILVGLAVTSHINSTLAKAEFGDVRIDQSDTTPPEIVLLGDDPLTVELGGVFKDPGFVAQDDIDGDITASVVVGGDIVDANKAGSYTITYNVVDAKGNEAEEVSRLVNVVDNNAFSLKINVGGSEVDFEEDTFLADSQFTDGYSYISADSGMEEPFSSERSSSARGFGYDIPLQNGTYDITLYFAEIYYGVVVPGGPGSRVFDVTLEGQTILDDYDIVADVGPGQPVSKTFRVEVLDGQFNLYLESDGGDGIDQPKLSALAILGVSDAQVGQSAFAAPNSMMLTPNPAGEVVNVKFKLPTEVVEFQIFDLQGRMIRRTKADILGDKHQLPVFDLPEGSYYVQTMDMKGEILQKQLLIQR